MKKILFSIIFLSYMLQADESQEDINTDIEMQDLSENKIVLEGRDNNNSSLSNVSNSAGLSSVTNPNNPGGTFTPSAGMLPAQSVAAGLTLVVPAAVASAAALGGVAGSPGSDMAAASIAATLVIPNSSSSSTGPANKNISNAQTNSALSVTTSSLNGATFEFTGFTGTATGGTFSSDLITLSNTTVTQDLANIAPGSLYYEYGNISGVTHFPDINLTGSTIDSATVTGAGTGDYFTGTNLTAGTISAGNFDVVFIEFPIGSVFNIVAGDLGPTGTFTTTSVGYAYLTGANNITSITNGTVSLVGSVNGTFNYLGTDVSGATLQGSTIFFTGVYAAGTATDANHLNASTNFTGTIANGSNIAITKNIATSEDGTMYISDGASAGQVIIGLSGVAGQASAGTFNSALTGYNGATLIITSSCIQGIDAVGNIYLDNPAAASFMDSDLVGTMAGGTNSIIFTASQIATGTISGLGGATDFTGGTCP